MIIHKTLVALLVVASLAVPGRVCAQHVVNYQGRLMESGVPKTGSASLVMSLWNASESGSQIGPAMAFDTVEVDGGLFSVDIPLDPSHFNGESRWLEVAIEEVARGGNLVTLSPRQLITGSPYALQTRGLYVDDNDYVGIGTTSPIRPLHVVGQAQISGSLFFDTPGIVEVAHENNTGMRIDPVANSVQLECDNSPVLTATVDRKVGIGTTSPQAKLSIDAVGTSAMEFERNQGGFADTIARLNISSDGAAPGLRFMMSADNGAAFLDSLFLSETTNVGIGTATPAAKLDVRTDTTHTGSNTANFTAANIGPNASHVHFGTNGDWYIRSAASTGKVILEDTGGNVGVGTRFPANRLTVGGDADFTGRVGIGTATPGSALSNSKLDINAGHILLSNNYGVFSTHDSGSGIGAGFDTTVDDDLRLYADGTEKVRVEASGDVGIGTSAPAGKLHIEGGTDAALHEGGFLIMGPMNGGNIALDNNEIMARNNGAPSALYLQNDGGDVLIGLNGNGYVGIKEVSPEAPLHVGGAAKFDGPVTIPTTTRYLTIGAPAFHPNSNAYISEVGGSPVVKRLSNSIFGDCRGLADVNLPHGAKITELRVYILDNSGSENMTVELRRYGVSSNSTMIATRSSFGAETDARSFATAVSHTVDASFAYYLKVDWDDNPANSFSFRAARITYTIDQPLP